MADNKVQMGLELTSNLDQENKKAIQLNKTLKEAGYSSGRVPGPVAAARQGMAANSKGPGDSSIGRSVGEGTGAAGRDFATQAQGLGGLVHVYATFAANLFAISAGFTALSKAANISNMIKGLDQLGAASGRNLGGLAKQLTEVSDGAISLSEAMTSVAQASSGGITNKNIIRMTEVAKKASQALGRDMTDALSRLTRGITKIEPELLDELGIMVKVDEASREYARTLGKTAASLTDFEKRQGYANAVLAEGEKKFGEISLSANPYQKVLASITNLAVSTGELVNKTLAPILNALASSPTALTATIAALGTVLVKQAIPALGQYRKNIQEMAEVSSTKLVSAYHDQQRLQKEADDAAQQQAMKAFRSQANIAAKRASLSEGLALQATKGKFAGVAELTKKDPLALTTDEIRLIDGRIKDLSRRHSDAYKNDYAALSGHIRDVKALRQQDDDVASTTVEARIALDERYFSHQNNLQRISTKAALELSNRRIRGLVAEEAATMGTRSAWTLLNEKIAERRKNPTTIEVLDPRTGEKIDQAIPKMNGFFGAVSNGALRLKGALTIATSSISTFLGAFGVWFQLIGLVTGAFVLLNSLMSKASKESDEYSSSLDAVSGSLDSIGRTIEQISRKDPLDQFTVETVQAKATALGELNDSLDTTIFKFSKLEAAQGGWEKFWDGFFDLFGKGNADKLAKATSQSITAALRAMDEGPTKDKARKAFEGILGQKVDFNNVDSINDSIKDLDKTVVASKASQIADVLRRISTEAQNAAGNLTGFKASLAEIGKEYDKIALSLKSNDPFSKVGEELIDNSNRMATSFNNSTDALLALSTIAGDLKALSFLPENTAYELASSKKQLVQLGAELATYRKSYEEAQKEAVQAAQVHASKIEQINTQRKRSQFTEKFQIEDAGRAGRLQTEAEQRAAAAKQALEAIEVKIGSATKRFGSVGVEMFTAGTELMQRGLTSALMSASIAAAKSYSTALKAVGASTANIDADIARQEIDLQIKDIEAKYKSIEAMEKLTLSVQQSTLAQQLAISKQQEFKSFEGKSTFTTEDKAKQDLLQLNVDNLGKAISIISSGNIPKGINAIKSDVKQNGLSPESSGIMALLRPLQSAGIEKQKATAAFGAQKEGISLNEQLGKVKELYTESNRLLELDNKSLSVQKEALDLITKQAGEYNPIIQQLSEQVANQQLLNSLDIEKNKAAEKYAQTLILVDKLSGKSGSIFSKEKAAAKDAAAKAKDELDKTAANRQERLNSQDLLFQSQRLAGAQALAKIEQEHALKMLGYSSEEKQNILTTQEAELNSRKALGSIQERDLIGKQSAIELEKQSLTYRKEALSLETNKLAVLANYSKDIAALREARSTATTDTQKTSLDAAIQSQVAAQARVTQELNAAISANDSLNDSRVTGINILREQNLELSKQDDMFKSIVSMTESLALIFGKVGAGIGAAVGILNRMAVKDTQYLKNKLMLQEELAKNTPSAKDDIATIKQKEVAYKTSAKNLAKLEEDNAIGQLNNVSLVAAATKNMFAEKTGAYKAFQVVERAAAAFSLAIQIQQNAAELAALPAKVAGGVSKIFSQLGAYGFPVAAAFIATMAALGFSGGSVTAPGGFSAEDQQKVQGTGQSYNNGSLGYNGGGALGDSTKKSTAIIDGIDRMAKNNYELLQYSRSKMYSALVGIRENTEQFVKLMVTGLRLNGLDTRSSSSSSLFGFSKRSTSVEDSGIIIKGLLSELQSGGGQKQQYENVKSTSSSFFGLIKNTKFNTNIKTLDDSVNSIISNIFKDFGTTLIESASTLGEKTTSVTDILKNFNVDLKVSSLGKTGEEYAADVMAAIGIQLDIAAKRAFPNLGELSDKFQQIGETTTDFVIRMVKTAEDVKLGLTSIGQSTNTDNISNLADFSQSLAKLTGGIDEFVSKTAYFKDNFLTDIEKLAPVQAAVTKELDRLGLSSVNTREEFAYVVKNLDLTTKSGQETYASLMNVSQGFAEVYQETRKVVSAEETLANLREQFVEILKLEGKDAQSLALSRELELEAMQEELKVGAKYIWAMQDQLDLKNQLTEAYKNETSALQDTINSITSSISALETYKQSLILGNDSILSPQQKYDAAKNSVSTLASTANSAAVTDAEKKAQADAIAGLPEATRTFLEASKTMFASSGQYSTDYNSVMDILNRTMGSLGVKKSEAQQQLDILNSSYSALNIIEQSTKTMADLMPLFISSQERSNAAMQAYYAAVGPDGPGMTVKDTSGVDNSVIVETMNLNTATMVKEINELNKQIDALRKDQQKQTGDLVIAQKAAADAIATAQKAAADATKAAQWINYGSPNYDTQGNWVSTGG